MKIITKREKIKGILDRWKDQYPDNGSWSDQVKATKELEKLNLNRVSEKRIIEIIGNNSWTRLECDECQQDKNKVVRFLERYEDEYGVNVCDVCFDCLKDANKLFPECTEDDEVKG